MNPRLEQAIVQIRTARAYTNDLLKHVPEGEWFRMPAEGVTHVAWQVGHLAIAQYRLALVRLRGVEEADVEFLPDAESYAKLFGKGSQPVPDASAYPSPSEIRSVFDAVQKRTVSEVQEIDDAVLDEPSEPPHPMFQTKLGALGWCAQHEFLHAGQIGLLRRLFGHDPLR